MLHICTIYLYYMYHAETIFIWIRMMGISERNRTGYLEFKYEFHAMVQIWHSMMYHHLPLQFLEYAHAS